MEHRAPLETPEPFDADRRPTPLDPAEPFDVFLAGLLFFDIVFTGLDQPPRPGAEVWTSGMGSGPGGIANFAVALSRLGLRTSLASAFGDDAYGAYCWQVLRDQEGVDLSHSRLSNLAFAGHRLARLRPRPCHGHARA